MSRDSSPAISSPRSALLDGDEREITDGNGISLELAPFGLEKLKDYEPGGLHPVHLGDLLGPGRRGPYRVLHKLGNGGYANIWLCRDMALAHSTQYIALKILVSDESTESCREQRAIELRQRAESGQEQDATKYLCFPVDEFEIRGPNGSHMCLVYPVLGPSVCQGIFRQVPSHSSILRRVAYQTTVAVDFLHCHHICHGGKY